MENLKMSQRLWIHFRRNEPGLQVGPFPGIGSSKTSRHYKIIINVGNDD